jgi:Domain of unknown function (DUF5658)
MLGIGDVGTAVSQRVKALGKKDVTKRKKAFILGGFCTAQVLDVTTTHIGLAQGRQELNGVAAWIIAHNGELAVYAIKLSLVAGLVVFLLFFGRRRSSIWNAYLIAAWITTFAVINNLYRILS